MSISHIGSASIPFSRCKFILNQLLRVPLICKNLLSVRQFAYDNNVFFKFHYVHFVIKDCQTGSPLHQGPLRNGLYKLNPSSSSSSINQALVSEWTSTDHWHKRLGHLALQTIKHVLAKFGLLVLPNKVLAPSRLVLKPKDINCHFQFLVLLIVTP